MSEQKIYFNSDKKFDLQLSQALVNERRLAEIFAGEKIERVELKSETWLWKRTGNLCIEYRCDGNPSGISTTEADWWVHEVKNDDGTTLGYWMLSVARLKELARAAIKAGRWRKNAGDGGRFTVALIRIGDILK